MRKAVSAFEMSYDEWDVTGEQMGHPQCVLCKRLIRFETTLRDARGGRGGILTVAFAVGGCESGEEESGKGEWGGVRLSKSRAAGI